MALMLAGALTPSGGEILVQGEPFNRERHRGYIGYVFQEPVNQIVTMKVVDELAFGPQQLGWEETVVKEVVSRELKRYDLVPEAVPLHLSPAEARKLAIAATLTMNPSLIILDEPTNNLDETETRHLMTHLKELQAEGTAVVVITHDVEVACQYADRVVVMAGGDILLDGPTRQVMARPDLLARSDVIPPPVVMTALALWPDRPPALTVDELAPSLSTHTPISTKA
jgi:energy-coupling factor transport system ATP-binding protein